MDKKKDISPDELLKKLRENLQIPEEPSSDISGNIENTEENKEDILRKKRIRHNAHKNSEQEYSESPNANTQDEAIPDADLFEAASATAQDELEAATKDPIEGAEEIEKLAAETQEFSLPSETDEVEVLPDTDEDIDIDELARKYLTPEEIAASEEEEDGAPVLSEEEAFVQQLSEAVDYVASIENQKNQEEPKEPQTETQKVIADLDLDGLSDESEEKLDEVDLNLMIAFGMTDELEEKLGTETLNDVSTALDKDAENIITAKEETLSTELPDDMEFISASQIKDVFAVYRRKKKNIYLRIFASVAMCIVIFFFEHLETFGGHYASWLEPTSFPIVHSMISLQLLVICLAFVWKPILHGLKGIFTFKPRTDSILALASLVTVLYHIGVCFLYNGSRTLFCNFPIALCAVLELIAELLSLKRDIYSFRIISSKRIKYAIRKIPDEACVAEREAFADYIEDEAPIFGVRKTSFVDGFFRRSRESEKGITSLRALLPLPVAVAVFFFVFSGLLGKNANPYNGIISAYVSFMLSIPFSALISYTRPFFRASRIAFENGGAIIGEESLDEYAEAAAISFDDKEVFPSSKVKIRSIKVYDNNRIDRVLYNLASLFIHIGGPLADVLRIATKDLGASDDVELIDIADDGIEAVISGKHIFYGTDSFLIRNNMSPIYDAEDEYESADSSVAYLVCNDAVAAKIYIDYFVDATFESIAKQLYHSGICLSIKTLDPCISNELLARFIDLEKYPIQVLKMHSLGELDIQEENTDSGIVSKKNTKSLLRTLTLCESISRAYTAGTFIAVLATLISIVITVFLVTKGMPDGSQMSLYTALYQLFWIIPCAIVARLTISKHR